jgi:hypothetical protein
MRDWIWNMFVAPWPDLGSKEFEHVRDLLTLAIGLLGLVVGGLSSWLAWLSIRMGREQDEVTQKETALLERLQELEAKQGEQGLKRELAQRQARAARMPIATGGFKRIEGATALHRAA